MSPAEAGQIDLCSAATEMFDSCERDAAGVAESTIRAHAKRDGWERDLSEDVRKKVRSTQAVRTDD